MLAILTLNLLTFFQWLDGWYSPAIKLPIVFKVDMYEFDLGIQQYLFWHDGVDNVLNLRPGVTCFLSARVR